MPRLNRRSDGGYFVTNRFTKHGVTKHTTYQVEPRGLEILLGKGIRSGNEIPEELFHELRRKGLLVTGGSGPGEEIGDQIVRSPNHSKEHRQDRRQIPIDVTGELLNDAGTFISFGAFKIRYGGPNGYSDDDLRFAYRDLNKRYELGLKKQLNEILSNCRPTSITRENGKIVVELIPQ